VRFAIYFYGVYGANVCRLRDMATDWQKNTILLYPVCILRPRSGWPRLNLF